MSIDLVRCWWMVQFAMPADVELSTWMGIDGFGCPISVSVVRRLTAYLAFLNYASISASAVDDMTCLMTT